MAGQIVEIPLTGGQNTAEEPTLSASPQLMLNCVYDKQGGVKKRAGCTKKAHNPNNYTFAALGSVSDPYRSRIWFGLSAPYDTKTLALHPHRDSIVAFGDCTQRVYDPSYDAWRTVDYGPTGYLADLIPVASTGYAYNAAFVSGGSMYAASNYPTYIANYDCAVNSSGLMAIVWVVVQGQPDGTGYRCTQYLRIIDLTTGRDSLATTALSSEDFTGTSATANKAARIIPYGANDFLCIETNFGGGATCGLYSRLVTQTTTGVRSWSYSTVVTNFGSSLVTGVGAGFNVGSFDVAAQAGYSNTYFVCTVTETSTQTVYIRTFTDANTPLSAIQSYAYVTMNSGAVSFDSAAYIWFNGSSQLSPGIFGLVADPSFATVNLMDTRLTNYGAGYGETTFGTVTGTDSVGDGSSTAVTTLTNVLTGTSNWQNWDSTGTIEGTPTASFGYGYNARYLSRPIHYQTTTGKLYLSDTVTASSEYTRVASLVLPYSPGQYPQTMQRGFSYYVATETHFSTPKWVWHPPRQRSTSLFSEENNRRFFGTRTMSSYGGLVNVAMWQAFRAVPGSAPPTDYQGLLPPKSYTYNGAAYTLVSTDGFDGFCTNLFVAKQSFTTSSGIVNAVSVNDTVYTAGGVVRGFDGVQSYEIGLAPPNGLATASPATGGATLTDGTYGVALVAKFTDANGNVIRSAPVIFEPTVTAVGDAITVQWWTSTPMDEHLNPEVEIYMTEANGTVYYFVGSFLQGLSLATTSATATFATNPDPSATQLYTTGGVLDNVPPPGCRHLFVHQGRLVLCGTPTDDVWYSREVLSGEIPAFNEGLTFAPFEGGRVLGGASLGDFMVLFKEGGVYGIRGSFPDDTGNGGSFPPPYSIQKGLRLQDSTSIVTTQLGVFFNTDRGIWVLSTEGQVEPIGLPIRERLGTQTINAAVYDDNTAFVMFFCSDGDVFVFDAVWKTWSTFVYKDANGATLVFEAACIGPDGKVYATDSAKRWLWDLSIATSLDDGTFVPMQFKGAYIKSGPSLAWQRVKRIGMRSRRTTDADVTLKASYDYDEDTTETRTYTSDSMGSGTTARECQMVPAIQKCSSFAVEYIDSAPTGSGHSTGNGNGFVLQSMVLEIKPTEQRRHIVPGKVK